MNSRSTILPDAAGLWGLVIFITLTLVGSNKALNDGDTLWHIKMGQVMLERGELLTHDIFSHTAYGKPWHAHEWLSEIVMAILYNGAGLAGVTIFYFGLVALTINLIIKIAMRLAGDNSPHLATILALPCLYIHLLARPHLFTWLGIATTLFLLEHDRRWQWLLIPLTTVWANLHGGVLFGLVVQAIYIAGGILDQFQRQSKEKFDSLWAHHKKAAAILGLCALAACLNPFGYQIFIFPFKVASPVFTQGISEWRSPDFQDLWFAKIWIIAILFMALWLGRQLAWRWHLLSLFMIWQTLGHVRNLSIGALLLIPSLSILTADLFNFVNFHRKSRSERVELLLSPRSGPILIVVLMIALIAGISINVANFGDRMQTVYVPPNQYVAVMEFLKKGYPEGNLLNDYEWGDYLLFGINPPPKVFIDGRADMYGEVIYSDYRKMANLEEETCDLMIKYEIKWALFPKDHILIRYLKECKSWISLYEDEYTEIIKDSNFLPEE